MIKVHSIRAVPPPINTEDAIALLKHLKDILMGSRDCLTATGKVQHLIMHYEAQDGTRH